MVIEKIAAINADIDSAWKVLGHDFAHAYKWASVVNHSEASGESLDGSSCSERGCEISGMGKTTEKLLSYSNLEHALTYQITDGMPSMIKDAINSWKLDSINHKTTRLTMKMNLKMDGIIGFLMKPMIKMQMTKMANGITEDFKFYVENGKPSKAKIKAMKKYNQ